MSKKVSSEIIEKERALFHPHDRSHTVIENFKTHSLHYKKIYELKHKKTQKNITFSTHNSGNFEANFTPGY